MRAITLRPDGQPDGVLDRKSLTSGFDEKWVQDLIFRNPGIVPMDEIRHGSGEVVPLARELSLPRSGGGGAVLLDILGVTREGRLVLVECKLWRNPQARREVIAQILEYAALLRQRTYADLTAQLKTKHRMTGVNPIFETVRAHFPDLDEARFTDAVSRSLTRRDFELIVAGDGIREDVVVIAELLQDQGSRLSLLELQLWSDEQGRTLVVPHLPFRTEVHKLRVYVDAEERPLEVDEVDAARTSRPAPEMTQNRRGNREFWQRFIDLKPFDHPDQPSPRHGGNNWVTVPLPGGARLTGFRTHDTIGFFLPERFEEAYATLALEEDEIRAEIDMPGLRFHRQGRPDLRTTLAIDHDLASLPTEEAQLAWLQEAGNRFINAIRPRLSPSD
jgi:hypothetical protein